MQNVGVSRLVKEQASVGIAYPQTQLEYISIRHPGYSVTVDDRVELLRLPCLDLVDNRFGFHYGTAKSACVAVTKRTGNLVVDTIRDTLPGDELQVEEFSWDDVLLPGNYVYYPRMA